MPNWHSASRPIWIAHAARGDIEQDTQGRVKHTRTRWGGLIAQKPTRNRQGILETTHRNPHATKAPLRVTPVLPSGHYERVDRRNPRDVVEELFRRGLAGEEGVIDELVAEDLVNHAAGGEDDLRGPQGRAGWKQILAMIYKDLGDEITIDHHHVIAEGEFVVDHMTIHGRHQASTMPLLAGTEVTDAPAAWTYIHIWRVVDGIVVEHWAVRDDLGLLRQLGAWPPPRRP